MGGLDPDPASPMTTERYKAWLALTIYAVAYFALLYHPGLIRLDDFGYLRSVAETFAAGRPHTDGWLEPYSAFTSSLCALAYLATGDFPLATWGLQSLFVIGNAILLRRWLRTRMGAGAATLLALALVSVPPYAHKCSEFAGNVWTLFCVLLALAAWRARKWGWFYAVTFLALANRQNAVALLALPAWESLAPFLPDNLPGNLRGTQPGKNPQRAILIGGAIFLVAAAGLHLSMNHTAAQVLGIYGGFPAGGWGAFLRTQGFGLFAALALLSALGWLTGDSPLANLRGNRARPALPLIATAAFVLLAVLSPLPLFSFLTPLLGSLDRGFQMQFLTLAVIPILLWTLDWRQLQPDAPLAVFAAFTFLSGLKGYWYDFYLIDVAVGALCFRLTRPVAREPGRLGRGLAWALLAFGCIWAVGYKVLCDKQRLSIFVYEKLERAGRIAPPDMTDGTFGYLGWKLAGPFNDLDRHQDLAGFQGFVMLDQVVLETEAPWRRSFKRGPVPAAEIIEEGKARIGWMDLRYRVLDLHGSPPVSLGGRAAPIPFDTAGYRPDPYPLDAREWDLYIRALQARGLQNGH